MGKSYKDFLENAFSEFDIPYIDYTKKTHVSIREYNGLVFVGGTDCADRVTRVSRWIGAVGKEITPEEAYKAARWCGLVQLSLLDDAYGLDRVERIVRSFGLIQVADDFYRLDEVYDGYSDVMYAVLRERGKHVRTVVGTRNLPNHLVTIETETIAKIRA